MWSSVSCYSRRFLWSGIEVCWCTNRCSVYDLIIWRITDRTSYRVTLSDKYDNYPAPGNEWLTGKSPMLRISKQTWYVMLCHRRRSTGTDARTILFSLFLINLCEGNWSLADGAKLLVMILFHWHSCRRMVLEQPHGLLMFEHRRHSGNGSNHQQPVRFHAVSPLQPLSVAHLRVQDVPRKLNCLMKELV